MTAKIESVLQIEDIASVFRVSIPTVKRWLHDAKRGKNNFPLPISGVPGRRLAWSRTAIEDFINETPQVVNAPKVESAAKQRQRHNAAMLELKQRHGVKIEPQKGKEVNE